MDSLGQDYPRLVIYLRSLPAGLQSHPECRVRASVFMAALAAAGPAARLDVPEPLRPLFLPPAKPWVPEVSLQAAILAIGDHLELSDAGLLEWNLEVNLALYRSLVYRALMAFMSPRTLLQRGATRWEAFHQGSTLTVLPEGLEGSAALRLDFPVRLFSPLLLRVYATAFRAALVHSRARDVSVEVAEAGETSARFEARWR